MKKAQVQTEVQIAEEDVDDVVGLAMRMMHEEEGQLSLREMQEVGEELDIPPEYIERAQAELQRERAATRAAEQQEAQRTAKLKRTVTLGVVVVAGVLLLWTGVAVSSLTSLHASVQTQAAQVANVTERKATVVEMYQGRADSPDKDAEIIGAENRIRVETKRYAELAGEYNAAAGSFPVALVRPLFGLPASVPLAAK